MPVIPIIIKPFTAFCNGEVIIITAGSSYIKEISSSFTGTNAFAVNAFHFLVIVLVRHSYKFLAVKELLWFSPKGSKDFCSEEVTNIEMFLKQPNSEWAVGSS